MIDPIDYVNPRIKNDHVPLQLNKKTIVLAKKKKQNPKEDFIVVRDDKHNSNVNLTVDSQENTRIPLQSTPSKSCLKEYVLNNDNKIETGTISSVTSWTSSSNEVLYSNNSWVINTSNV